MVSHFTQRLWLPSSNFPVGYSSLSEAFSRKFWKSFLCDLSGILSWINANRVFPGAFLFSYLSMPIFVSSFVVGGVSVSCLQFGAEGLNDVVHHRTPQLPLASRSCCQLVHQLLSVWQNILFFPISSFRLTVFTRVPEISASLIYIMIFIIYRLCKSCCFCFVSH